MNIEISFEVIKQRHPEAVTEIMAKLRSGKSKMKGSLPESMTWSYDWGVQSGNPNVTNGIDGLMEMIKEHRNSDGSLKKKTIKQRIEAIKPNILFWVQAKIGRWWGNGTIISKEVPKEILDFYRKCYAKEEQEQNRVDNLSEEERQAETRECLKQLGMNPGFFSVTIRDK